MMNHIFATEKLYFDTKSTTK